MTTTLAEALKNATTSRLGHPRMVEIMQQLDAADVEALIGAVRAGVGARTIAQALCAAGHQIGETTVRLWKNDLLAQLA